MRTISLRRTKDLQIGNKSLVGLPPKTVETCFVELYAEEREQYDRMETDAKLAVNEFICADSVMRNYSTVLHIILRLRQICNCMDLCPLDIRSLFPSSSLEGNLSYFANFLKNCLLELLVSLMLLSFHVKHISRKKEKRKILSLLMF